MPSLIVRRAALLTVAAIALIALFAGLARLGIPFSVAGARAPSHGPLFVLGVLVLHSSLVARWSGDLFGLPLLRQAGGLSNALALLAFPGCVFWARRRQLLRHDRQLARTTRTPNVSAAHVSKRL